MRLARRPSGRRLELGGGWAAEVAFDRLRVRGRTREVGRAGAREVEEVREVVEVVADEGRGCAQFGEFRLEWSAEVAPERLARGDWTTWIAGGAWEVRPLRPGDALVPLGGISGITSYLLSRKLKMAKPKEADRRTLRSPRS